MPDPSPSRTTPFSRPVRLFFALWPDFDTVRALTQWCQQAHGACGGRIMRADTLHLTLAFLGETAPALVQPLVDETRRRRIEPGQVILSRLGAFPRPRIVWAGPADDGDNPDEGAGRLASEHRQLWDWVAALHPARPETRFRPHVTLLRDADTRLLPPAPAQPIAWRFDRYVLVASAQDGRSRYQILAETLA
ncbi:RNA 2',3'-cyclic phosphodiesterase [Bordetella genomosp. 9]|uniref:RNA 2',3'-cyclic phosphodiesterase n=1 Tax=Bordetella genomosp. 9 TaxID=1416803 RepID=A0A1W6Z591_9BORD|nr:RNA 2',3'-cyclic phosphodiesterase [Bordetella genomosp. 9]ARP88456.1 2'-5' RNA ligase [Bordetella genomosp. 9]